MTWPAPVRARALLAALASAPLLSSCSSGGGAPTTPGARPPVASIAVVAGTGQAGAVNTVLGTAVQVRAQDGSGNPIANDTINFFASTGGAVLSQTFGVTDAAGIATVAWTLGRCPGTHTIVAIAQRTPSTIATLSATATGGIAGYCVELLYTIAPNPTLKVAAEAAATRWSAILNGTSFAPETLDFNPATLPAGEQKCAGIQMVRVPKRIVKNVVILVELTDIPSPTPGLVTLGSAGPCYIRTPGNVTVFGGLRLNSTYLINNLTAAQREDVVLHEMGHVLGFGTLWDEPAINLLVNPIVTSGAATQPLPGFTGVASRAMWTTMGGPASPASVPVEGCGSGGTVNGHWRESAFGDELMTGYISAPGGGHNPLSKLTLTSMQDMGYSVDITQADFFTINVRACPAVAGAGVFNVGSVVIVDKNNVPTAAVETLTRATHIVYGGQHIPIVRR